MTRVPSDSEKESVMGWFSTRQLGERRRDQTDFVRNLVEAEAGDHWPRGVSSNDRCVQDWEVFTQVFAKFSSLRETH